VAWSESCLHAKFHLDPSKHLATIHQRYRQDRTDRTDRTQDRRRLNSIGRTVLQTVAQKVATWYTIDSLWAGGCRLSCSLPDRLYIRCFYTIHYHVSNSQCTSMLVTHLYLVPGWSAKYCDDHMSVCLSVGLSVYVPVCLSSRLSQESNFTKFLASVVDLADMSSSNDSGMHYVLPTDVIFSHNDFHYGVCHW